MQAELQATCSALGYFEGSRYIKEPDCIECVKDLIRFLKRDDETCAIRRQLGEANIVQNDLIPLLKGYSGEKDLFDCVTRLAVNLTQPAIFCFHNTIPDDKALRNNYIEIEGHLQAYKQKCVDEELFEVLSEKLGDMFKLDWETRHEADRTLIERLLIFIRNVLHVPPNYAAEQRTDDDASVHDQILWVMNVSGLSDLVVYLASSPNERQYCIHVLEIVSLMFREQTAENLALACTQRAVSEKEKDKRELDFAREKEQAEKREKCMKATSRHSRFGGTFVVKNVKSISEREAIYHKPLANSSNFSLEVGKQAKKRARNRQPIKDRGVYRRSTLSIRLHLKDFCVQILENCYNPLMLAVKDNLVRERTQENDETYYLWAMRFFMEFCRLYSSRVDLISETMSIETFHYIHTNLVTYYEMIVTDKKQAKTWSKRMHLALKAYQELLYTLNSMDHSPKGHIRESAKVIKSNIFYVTEYRDIFVTLLKRFDESRQSREYLTDLVEATHLFIKMLEGFKKTNRHMVVEKKRVQRKKRKKIKPAAQTEETTPEQLEELWDDISTELSEFCQGREAVPENVAPFDAASDVPIDQQRVDAMIRIQDSLRNKDTGEGLAMLRAAREVWPERGEFGSADISPEEEFMALREVFMTTLPRTETTQETRVERDDGEQEGNEEMEEEIPEEEEVMTSSEQEFNLREYVCKFTKPEVLQTYSKLLADFEINSIHANHCVVKMFHRVSVDLGLVGMLFQLSTFRVFHNILRAPGSEISHMKELSRFVKFVMHKFTLAAQNNDLLFMEMLFWKSAKEGSELEAGYGSFTSSKVKSAAWSEEAEQEVRRLFEEHNSTQLEGKDTVDIILEHLSDQSRTRGQVIRELKKQNLISSATELTRQKAKTKQVDVWLEEHEAQLHVLFDQYKESKDVVGCVRQNLSVDKSKKQIVDKIVALGLVQDKSELNKGRKKKVEERETIKPFTSTEFIITSDESSGDEDAVTKTTKIQTTRTPGKDVKHRMSRKTKSHVAKHKPLKQSEIVRDVAALIRDGWKDPLAWIQRCLLNASKTRTHSTDPQAIPLVPLSEVNEDAMEDETFLAFLARLGLAAPANEQEAFWRIPAHLTSDELTRLSQSLDPDTHDADTHDPETHDQDTRDPDTRASRGRESSVSSQSSDDDDSDRGGGTPATTHDPAGSDAEQRGTKRRRKAILLDSDDDVNEINDADASTKHSKRAKFIELDDDENHASDDESRTGGSKSPRKTNRVNVAEMKERDTTVKTRRKIIAGSSESEDYDEPTTERSTHTPQEPQERNLDVDSESDRGDGSVDKENMDHSGVSRGSKRSKILDSDDDVGATDAEWGDVPQRRRKRAKIIDSDESDDETVSGRPSDQRRATNAILDSDSD